MRSFLFVLALVITPLCYSQDTGTIIGKLMDAELKDSPLVMAEVSLKEASKKTNTDINGMFVFENLKAGDYTLVYSFAGYESKEIKVRVEALDPLELKLTLAASQVSMNDIALAMAMANSNEEENNTSNQ